MKAADVMVPTVVTVGPDASVQDVARVLLSNRISALPVVDPDGAIIGMISEGDLINRTDTETAHRKSWWLTALSSNDALASEYITTHSRRVSDIMTRDVITARPETPISEIAALLEKHGIKRVPIVQDNKLIGIVSRANLIQGLASLKAKVPQSHSDDAAIRDDIMRKLRDERWSRPGLLTVTVHDGTVDLWGTVESETEKKAVGVLVEVTSGVRAINDNLIVEPVLGYS
jgi:CBS domain-containing protein